MSDLLTVSEVAHMLRVNSVTVRRWVKSGALRAVVLPRKNKRHTYRIRREDLNTILSTPKGTSANKMVIVLEV